MVQVLVRLQWVMEVMRGQSTHMEVSLEGLATSVMGGLQDELFNLTLDNLQVSFAPDHVTLTKQWSVACVHRPCACLMQCRSLNLSALFWSKSSNGCIAV